MKDWRNAMVPLVFECKSSACLVLPPGFKKSLAYLLCNTAMSSMKQFMNLSVAVTKTDKNT